MGIAGAYTLDLYCDCPDGESYYSGSPHDGHKWHEFPHQFVGDTRAECKRKALKKGWTFRRDGLVICPTHSKKLKRKPTPTLQEGE